jgi:hypothetical protein
MFGDQWLAKNAARRYPLDELASAVDDYGSRLPDGFIVDVCLTIPGGHSQRVGILGASVQENGVSVVFGDVGNPADPSEVPLRLLATASITGAATRAYRPVVVTPLLSGVGGLVTFGPRADGAPASWVFSGTNATLAPRCVRTNGSLTPGTLSLAYSETSMNGAVRLVAGSDLEIVKESREIGTVGVRDAVVFRLVQSPAGQNVFDAYRGPCGGRPESGTCDRPPIEAINTISPDCSRTIRLNFEWPLRARPIVGGGGIVVDYAYGLAEVCGAPFLPQADGKLPITFDDGCEPGAADDPDANAEPPPIVRPPSTDTASSSLICQELPVCVDFSDNHWEITYGAFEVFLVGGANLTMCPATEFDQCWQVSTPATLNIALWNNCAYASPFGKQFETSLYVPPDIPRVSGGIVTNFRKDFPAIGSTIRYRNDSWDSFILFELVCDRGIAQIKQWVGGLPRVRAQTSPMAITPGNWYTLILKIQAPSLPEDDGVEFHGQVCDVDGSGNVTAVHGFCSFVMSHSEYVDSGLAGVGSDRGASIFSMFGIRDVE